MSLLTRADLDRFAARGCSTPGCKHDHAAEPFAVRSRCHWGAPLFASLYQGVVTLACAECSLAVLEIRPVDTPLWLASWRPLRGPGGIASMDQDCHPQSALWPSYRHGSGVVDVACSQCRLLVASFRVE